MDSEATLGWLDMRIITKDLHDLTVEASKLGVTMRDAYAKKDDQSMKVAYAQYITVCDRIDKVVVHDRYSERESDPR